MKEESSFWDKLIASGKDALNPVNILIRILMFFVFGVLTAFSYLISNLNSITAHITSQSGFWIKAWYFLKALMGATWKGMFIGFSSLWQTLLNVFAGKIQFGDMLYGGLVLLFGVWVIYQPVSILFDIADMRAGKHYSKFWALLSSLVLLLVIIAPLSYMALGGETLTSDVEQQIDVPEEVEAINTTTNETQGDLINTIDMTGGS